MSRSEPIFADQGRVGTLDENAGAWKFTYAHEWLKNPHGFDLSPGMPRRAEPYEDTGTSRPVQWFFDNLLPEGALRNLMAKELNISGADAFGFLQAFGRETFGAFSVGEVGGDGSLVPLSFEELTLRIQRIPRVPLDKGAPKKMSLAGAQPKLLVVYQDGQLYEPEGAMPSTHILKPLNASDGYPDTVINEYYCMRLAGACGLNVPRVNLLRIPDPVYLIERFDRLQTQDGKVVRTHAIDGAQMLSMHGEAKYAFNVEDLKRCIQLTTMKAASRLGILRWTIFNALIGNADAHIKNISFMATPKGISLAPIYDLVSTASYTMPEDNDGEVWPNVKLTSPVGKAMYFSELTREDIALFAEELGVNPVSSLATLDNMIDGVIKYSALLADEIDRDPKTTAGERRRIRVIRYSVINQMVERFRTPAAEAAPSLSVRPRRRI